MRIWLVVLFAGCWTSSSPEPAHPVTETPPPPAQVKPSRTPREETVLMAMERFRDQMCACRDRACADLVQDGMNRWSAEMARRMGTDDRDRKLDDEDVKQLTALTEDYGKCMMAAMTAATGGNPCTGP